MLRRGAEGRRRDALPLGPGGDAMSAHLHRRRPRTRQIGSGDFVVPSRPCLLGGPDAKARINVAVGRTNGGGDDFAPRPKISI